MTLSPSNQSHPYIFLRLYFLFFLITTSLIEQVTSDLLETIHDAIISDAKEEVSPVHDDVNHADIAEVAANKANDVQHHDQDVAEKDLTNNSDTNHLKSKIAHEGNNFGPIDEDEWSQCNCPANDPNYNDDSSKPTARIAYLISVHNRRTLHDGAFLLKALMETSHPGNTAIIVIHIDKKVGIALRSEPAAEDAKDEDDKKKYLYHDSPLRAYVESCLATPACTGNNEPNSNATILEVKSYFSPEWSKWSMNDPTLWGMDYLLHHPELRRNKSSQKSQKYWDVFINLSGDSLPVISAQRISQLFEPANGPLGNTNFVTSASCKTGFLPTSIFEFPKGWMKRAHYFQRNIPKKLSYFDFVTGKYKVDVEVPIYFGSQWMSLTRDFVEYVIQSMDHPNGFGNVLKETLIETGVLMTDETFFATILMNSPSFAHTLPKVNEDGALERYPTMHTLRYERMDENAPGPWGEFVSLDPLYDIPPKFGKATDGEGAARPWGPYFLGTYDLGSIRDSGALFVRKVSWTVDENLVRMLPVVKSEIDDKLEWEELPDFRWPILGVNVKDPFAWKLKKIKGSGDHEEEE